MTLSTEDRHAIEELYARYAWTFDFGQAEAWAEVFTPDGVLGRYGFPDVTGTEELIAFARDRDATPGIIHHNSNLSFEATPTGARGRAYCLVLRAHMGEPLRIRNFAFYEDEMVKVDGEWRFTKRQVEFRLEPKYVDAPFALEGVGA